MRGDSFKKDFFIINCFYQANERLRKLHEAWTSKYKNKLNTISLTERSIPLDQKEHVENLFLFNVVHIVQRL